MTLQELLSKYNVPAEGVTEINQAVDTLIDAKVSAKNTELEKVQGDLNAAREELSPFKKSVREKHIKGLLPKNAKADVANDIITLAGVTDEDDDKTITKKLADTVNAREYFRTGEALAPELNPTPGTVEVKTEVKSDNDYAKVDVSNL